MQTQLIGIGVGPANLSLASLLSGETVSNVFLDRREGFAWHAGMQLPHANLQVSLFKDLVTLADPTNPYSFLAYLHASGRIYHFLNARFDAVTRKEFSLYLDWAARLNPNVCFGEEVLDIRFDGDFAVTTDKRELRSHNIAVGVGQSPKVPIFARNFLGARQFHSADFIWKAGSLGGKCVAVVGGGQSGAEIFLNLLARSGEDAPERISWVSRRTCYWPIDDTAFTNDLFMPCHQSYFASLDEATRKRFLIDNVLASDGISADTLKQIYQTLYLRRYVDGEPNRVALLPGRAATGVSPAGLGWHLELHHRNLDVPEEVFADVVIWATGYENPERSFLGGIEERIERVGDEFRVDAHFRAVWDGPADRSIFIQNGTRAQKGLADPNLSLLAWRSECIIGRLTGRPLRHEQVPSHVTWAPVREAAVLPRRRSA